jgi:hypothetical protein
MFIFNFKINIFLFWGNNKIHMQQKGIVKKKRDLLLFKGDIFSIFTYLSI